MRAGADAVDPMEQLQGPSDGAEVCVGCSLSWHADYMQVTATEAGSSEQLCLAQSLIPHWLYYTKKHCLG